ncbi:MAG: ABC transporter substrate-binding protein [Actinomycetaceae bacterium]|nr:ABC transporter substrate-binding protein [Actinomycetaceae bacterium]
MRTLVTASVVAAASLALATGCQAPDAAQPAQTATPTTPSSTAFPVTLKHPGGETTIDKAPERIVVLDMAALDTIDAIGAGEKVVGTTVQSLPEWLKDNKGVDYSKVTNVGSLKEPDVEAIASLDPDLVVVASRSASLYGELSKKWTTIDATATWDSENYTKEATDAIKLLGDATGHADEASKAAAAIDDKIKKYKDSASNLGKAAVIMTNGGEISLHGPKSRWAPIFDVFGFTPVTLDDQGADQGHKGKKLSFETLADLNPDWIFVVDRDAAVGKGTQGASAKEVLNNDLVNATKAAKDGHIVYLDPVRWYIVMTGASNYPAELDEIAAAIR